MRSELNDSLDHLMQAANHGAAVVGETTGPKWESTKAVVSPRIGQARSYASTGWGGARSMVAPMIAAAVGGATEANKKAQKQARKTSKEVQKKVNRKLHRQQARNSRKGMTLGLLAAGVAAGAG